MKLFIFNYKCEDISQNVQEKPLYATDEAEAWQKMNDWMSNECEWVCTDVELKVN